MERLGYWLILSIFLTLLACASSPDYDEPKVTGVTIRRVKSSDTGFQPRTSSPGELQPLDPANTNPVNTNIDNMMQMMQQQRQQNMMRNSGDFGSRIGSGGQGKVGIGSGGSQGRVGIGSGGTGLSETGTVGGAPPQF